MLLLDDMGLCPHASHHWSCAHPSKDLLNWNQFNSGLKSPQGKTDFEKMKYWACADLGIRGSKARRGTTGDIIPYHQEGAY